MIDDQELAILKAVPGKKESTPLSGASALLRRSAKRVKKSKQSRPEDKSQPIHDLSHARNALAGVGQHHAPEKQKKMKPAGESCRIAESAEITGAIDAAPQGEGANSHEGPIAHVIIISEGLGNLRDKNYYGPEAIQSAVEAFEGKPMLIDHPSYSQEQDLPERSVKETVGYYKHLKVIQSADGKTACAGELHFDLTQEGQNAYQKAKTSVHYKREFPDSSEEYVGISINAQGESTQKTMTIDGETIEVNYVTRFVKARSADMVTIPARGGKFVALLESVSGARMKNKEARMQTVKSLKAAQAALKEAENSDIKDPAQRLTKIAEAKKLVEGLLADIEKAAKKKEAEGEMEDGEESAESHKPGCEDGECEGCSKKEGEDGDDGDGDDDGKPADDGDSGEGDGGTHQVTTTHKATGKAAMIAAKAKAKEESMESHKLAVEALIAKSELNPKYFDKKELFGMSLSECKREIARTKRVHEASAEELMKKVESMVPAAHMVRESSGSTEGNGGKGSLNLSLPALTTFGGSK